MRTGVHCSVRKGFVGALEEAVSLGCGTFQMFTQSPRGWRTRVYTDEEFAAFRKAREKSGVWPVVVHAPYLPNLCTSHDDLYLRSLNALKADLQRSAKLDADYLVVHPGAFSDTADLKTGLDRIGAAFNEALAEIPGKTMVLVENMAGGGRRVGGPFSEIKEILARVKNQKRIGVCLDTCHTIAAGYDISNTAGVKATLDEFQREVGLDRIHVVHVNDSKTPCGSHRDMHQHLGKGSVGDAGFKAFFAAFDVTGRAFVLETPKLPIPQADRENLKKLNDFIQQRTAASAA